MEIEMLPVTAKPAMLLIYPLPSGEYYWNLRIEGPHEAKTEGE